MAHVFQPGMLYRMPVMFGPMPGPRQAPPGRTYDANRSPRARTAAVSFLTRAGQLEALMPEGFALWGEPVVTADLMALTDIEWLAGRGYTTFGMRWPCIWRGQGEPVKGMFLSLVWENLADPIISGREELGFNKLYAELPEPRVVDGAWHFHAAWMGHRFFELDLTDLKEVAPEMPANPESQGTLHYKWMPKTGDWGTAEAAYATLSPAVKGATKVERRSTAVGAFRFVRSTWEELPTLFHIVNTFADLELKEFRGASLTYTVGGSSHLGQRILR